MPLTATQIKNAKPREKTYRLFDERGLYLEISPKGGKWWRFKYRFEGKEKRISLGVFPEVGLRDARERRDEARKLVANETDPSQIRRIRREVRTGESVNTFQAIAREWFEKQKATWSPDHGKRIWRRLEKDVFPLIGKTELASLTPKDLLAVAHKIEKRDAFETAHRAMQNCGQVLRYAVATGRAERDLTQDLKGALTPVKQVHLATITDPHAIGELLRAIDGYDGFPSIQCALRLAPLVFVRPGELRQAEWSEFDLDRAEWKIPEEKMKMRRPHIVPLSHQAVEILRTHSPLRRDCKYVFPSVRSNARPISANTLNAALRRLGYTKDQMTTHGFRSMASTLLNEQGWPRDAIERQLAHVEGNSVRAAYNYAEHMEKRREMMQAWADSLDGLRDSNKVTPILARQASKTP